MMNPQDTAIKYLEARRSFDDVRNLYERYVGGEPYADREMKTLCCEYVTRLLGLGIEFDDLAISPTMFALYILSGVGGPDSMEAARIRLIDLIESMMEVA